jgi:hypothetical protein
MPRPLRTAVLLLSLIAASCDSGPDNPRLSMFVGVDISGSFMNSGYYDDAIDFLARYLYAHINGLGGLEEPNVLFVSSIGGADADDPKTFFPKQTFEDKSIEEIASKLREIFPQGVENPYTDYNAFFEQIALMVRNRKLILRPISIVMVSDGRPDVKKAGETDFRSIQFKPLETLSRNITVRLLYTTADVGNKWQTRVPRSRVKVWTQDAEVMVSWKEPTIYLPDKPIAQQESFFRWVKENVNYGVAARRVD